jgi:hypothetical protein
MLQAFNLMVNTVLEPVNAVKPQAMRIHGLRWRKPFRSFNAAKA